MLIIFVRKWSLNSSYHSGRLCAKLSPDEPTSPAITDPQTAKIFEDHKSVRIVLKEIERNKEKG